MVDFLNDDVTFRGTATAEGEFIADGTLTIGPGGVNVGPSIDSPDPSWAAQTRVQVANVAARNALVAWRAANSPISPTNPLLVWRADGSITGINEITLDGANWYAESAQAGDIEMTMAAAAPYGWLLCQGQLLANAAVDYPALWANASTAFRSGGSLRLPDLRGRVPMGVGLGTGLTLRNIGDLLGAEDVALSANQLAAHSHPIDHAHGAGSTSSDGSHSHSFSTAKAVGAGQNDPRPPASNNGASSFGSPSTDAAGSHSHSVTVPAYAGNSGSVGAGDPHPNIPPAVVVNFKVKV